MLGFGPIGSAPIGASGDFYTIPASETPEGQARLKAYYEALGRFIDIFSEVEATVTHTLRKYAETRPEIAKVIFARIPLDASVKLILETAAVTQDENVRIGLKDVFKQLDDIRIMRNYVLHNGATNVAEGNATVSNALKAQGDPIRFPISPELLDQMRDDLGRINLRLAYEHLGRPRPQGDYGNAVLDAVLNAQWKYIHPKQGVGG